MAARFTTSLVKCISSKVSSTSITQLLYRRCTWMVLPDTFGTILQATTVSQFLYERVGNATAWEMSHTIDAPLPPPPIPHSLRLTIQVSFDFKITAKNASVNSAISKLSLGLCPFCDPEALRSHHTGPLYTHTHIPHFTKPLSKTQCLPDRSWTF
jgi:hypothetical protein